MEKKKTAGKTAKNLPAKRKPRPIGDPALRKFKKSRDQIMRFIRNELVEDVDYGIIEIKSKKTGKVYKSKPTLFKSGSEKFASLLNLKPVFKRDDEMFSMLPENIKNNGVFLMRCELVHRDTGKVISEGRGATSLTENNMYGDINKAIKIAEKRAQLDAVLRIGLSDSFTQDLEDYKAPVKMENGELKRETKKYSSKEEKEINKKIKTALGILKWGREKTVQYIKVGFTEKHTLSNLTLHEKENLIKFLNQEIDREATNEK